MLALLAVWLGPVGFLDFEPLVIYGHLISWHLRLPRCPDHIVVPREIFGVQATPTRCSHKEPAHGHGETWRLWLSKMHAEIRHLSVFLLWAYRCVTFNGPHMWTQRIAERHELAVVQEQFTKDRQSCGWSSASTMTVSDWHDYHDTKLDLGLEYSTRESQQPQPTNVTTIRVGQGEAMVSELFQHNSANLDTSAG